MKINIVSATLLIIIQPLTAQIADPISAMLAKSKDPVLPTFVRWNTDLNGDGKSDALVSRKDSYMQDIEMDTPQSWFIFLTNPADGSYKEIEGIQENGDESIGVSLPGVDIRICYVGEITELGKIGIVSQQIDNPQVGEPIAYIYVYTVEENHLKRTKLAEYNPKEENATYNKYLKEDKRTTVMLSEVAP